MNCKRLFAFLLVTVILPVGGQAEVNRSWELLVESIHLGKNVVVTRMNAGQVAGELLAINADLITVKQHGISEVIRRTDVFRVRYANIRMRHTLWGLAIGIGTGIAIGAAGTDEYQDLAAIGMAFFGAGIGSAVGAALPIGPPLYEAERIPREKLATDLTRPKP